MEVKGDLVIQVDLKQILVIKSLSIYYENRYFSDERIKLINL